MPRPIDLTGQRFGALLVLERDGATAHGRARWRCRCDCGAVVSRVGRNLRAGIATSCGCLSGAKPVKRGEAWTKRRAYRRELYWRRKREREMVWRMATMKW